MANEHTIRQMELGDWDAFSQLDKEIFPDDMMREEWFRLALEREAVFALDINGVLAGLLILSQFGSRDGILRRIGVAGVHQGEGYGKLLMRYAIEWFHDKDFERAHLYTQDFNLTAQNLYKQFGFRVSGMSWQYFVPFKSLNPSGKYTCQEISESEIRDVGEKYGETLPEEQLRRFLSSDQSYVMSLKNHSGELKGVCRFIPELPGCYPFLIERTACFDDFLSGIRHLGRPEFDYVRVTFSDFPRLANLCRERGYKLHHRLFKMTLELR